MKALASRKYQSTLLAVALVVLRVRLGLEHDDVKLACALLAGYIGVEGGADVVSRARIEPKAEPAT